MVIFMDANGKQHRKLIIKMGRTRYTSGCHSEAGRAAKNQDTYSLFDITLPDGGSGPRRTVKVAITADGINGHQGGEIASQNAVVVIKSTFTLLDVPVLDRMQRAIQQANRSIYDQSLKDPKVRGMGCTVVMAVLDAEKLYLANVGDSRSYLIRDGIAHQLTEDHTRMESSQSSTPQLTRRLGRTSRVNIDLGCIPLGSSGNKYVDRVSSIDLQQGDALLLCTDGLTSELADDYIQQIVSSARSPQAAAQQLVAKAKAAGTTDDITALVVRWPNPTRRNVWLLGLMLVLGLLWLNWGQINTDWITPLQSQLHQNAASYNKKDPRFPLPTWILELLPSPTATSTDNSTVAPTNTSSPTPTLTPLATNTLTPEPNLVPAQVTIRPTFTAIATSAATPAQTSEPALPTRVPLVTPTPVPPTATPRPTSTAVFPSTETSQDRDLVSTTTPAATGNEPGLPTPVLLTATATLSATATISGSPSLEVLAPKLLPTAANLSVVVGNKVTFQWLWQGELPPKAGFEIRVWQGAGTHDGVHNAYDSATSVQCVNNICQLTIGISILEGDYNWEVAIVQLDPYKYDAINKSLAGTLRITGSSTQSNGQNRCNPQLTNCPP